MNIDDARERYNVVRHPLTEDEKTNCKADLMANISRAIDVGDKCVRIMYPWHWRDSSMDYSRQYLLSLGYTVSESKRELVDNVGWMASITVSGWADMRG